MFLTFAWYVDRWWEGEDPENRCTPEQRESVLPYTLAPLQFEFIDDYNATTDTGIVSIMLAFSIVERSVQLACHLYSVLMQNS